ncbi:N-acetylneuraminate synthase [Lachnospiraceae bacterium C10]|nr:N-acetylneuraminate synthase [Lachnospiraceae bacterium C10]
MKNSVTENNNRTLIIAEAGVNHNGSVELAKKLIDTAKDCGADIVKFQTAKLDSLVSKTAHMADYQKRNIGKEQSQKEMLQSLLLSYDEFIQLAEYCNQVGIKFLSTPFDIDSIHFLNDMQDIWKIPSGEITNYPYLIEIAKTGKKVILSTGMAEMDEIEAAINVLKQNGTEDITILHCTTEYPAPIHDVNLRVMETLRENFGFPVGYSDHTKGIEVDLAAVALGASVIEKHFTLDRNLPGPDHKASLEPSELKAMVEGIRKVEMALGSSQKKISDAEKKNRDVARKSIVAKKYIKKGEVLSEVNVTTKRPGTGIDPMRWNDVIGTKAIRDFNEDELIEI